ncbi:hypothetical protein [Methanocella conradii]|uniref:hypothetical protein n=1 Tax=Methanocella conradii TaxID=1175444 RepID=UPI00157D2578|nr:hypothetical protein [Methanocella conradii]
MSFLYDQGFKQYYVFKYEWQRRWSKDGVRSWCHVFARGMPSRLDEGQKKELRAFLAERDDRTTREARDLILEESGVEYTLSR